MKLRNFAVVMMALSALFATAGDPPQPLPIKQPTVPNPDKPVTVIPHTPAYVSYIYVQYETQEKSLVFSGIWDINYMTVEVESAETGVRYFGSVTADEPAMHVELATGEFYITCSTDDGATYAGPFSIE